MLRKALSFGGLLLLAGATVLVTPGLGQARGGGGHGGGGFHGGGFHGSGVRGGGSHGGGVRSSGFHGYYGRPYAHYGYRNYGGYGYYPYYGDYGYSPYYYSSYANGWPNSTYDAGYSYGNETPSYPDSYYSVTPPTTGPQSIYSPAPAESDTIAQLTVSAPANAEIWVNGSKTTSTGPVREYQSPPLARGKHYAYDLSARWIENGHEVTQTRTVDVSSGAHVSVAFPNPPAQKR